MSKEHAHAYEAGYRDGSINYELEHCPACKNVADLQEALAENAKLREELDAAKHDLSLFSERIVELGAENAKLRELVRDMWDFSCVIPDEPHTSKEELDYSVEVWKRMRELGVEVDE